jgi:anti-anti-sigma factor
MGSATLEEPAVTPAGRPAVVPWKGPLDSETVARFEARIAQQLRETEEPVLLDLRRVDYIDSAGLRFLLALRDRLSSGCRKIILVVARESRVERTLRLMGFDRLFDLVSRPVREWRRSKR